MGEPMADFRRIEHELARFFAGQGFPPTACNGELYIGVASTRYMGQTKVTENGTVSSARVVIDLKPDTEIISLSDLASEITQLTHQEVQKP